MAAKKDDGVPKVTATSTKKEMMEAFNELKKRFQEKDQFQLKPEKQKEEKQKKEVIKTAGAITPEGTVNHINQLKMEVAKTLTQLSEKLEDEASKYLKLQEGIRLKEDELKEIYDIENSAYTLAALLEAQKQKKIDFEEEMTQRKQNLEEELAHKKNTQETEINQLKESWQKEKEAHAAFIKERDSEEKKTREREKEEFLYNFNREKQLNENAFKDEKGKQEKQLAAAKEAFEQKVNQKDKILAEREEKVKEREKLVDDLQKQVDTFPGRLEAAVDKAVTETSERLLREAKQNEELLKKGYDGEKNVLQTKIDALEQLVKEQAKQLEDLSSRMEKSYSKVQDIAVKAIEGSSASHRFSTIEKHLIEQQKKSIPQETS